MMSIKKAVNIALFVGWYMPGIWAMYPPLPHEVTCEFFADEESSAWAWDGWSDLLRKQCDRYKKESLEPVGAVYANLWHCAQQMVGCGSRGFIPAFSLSGPLATSDAYAVDPLYRFVTFNITYFEHLSYGMVWFTLLRAALKVRDEVFDFFAMSENTFAEDEKILSARKKVEFDALAICNCHQCLTEVVNERLMVRGELFEEVLADVNARLYAASRGLAYRGKSMMVKLGEDIRLEGFDADGYLKTWVFLATLNELKKTRNLCAHHRVALSQS